MPSSVALLDPAATSPIGSPKAHTPLPGHEGGFKLFGEDGLTFDDILDIINPLQHIPVIGPIYRAITGDTISPASKMSGGALYGGPIGFAASFADTMLEQVSGKDAGAHILALLGSDDPKGAPLSGAEEDRSRAALAPPRNGANEEDDSSEGTQWTPVAVAATNGALGQAPSRGPYAVSLRHDFYDRDDGDADPGTAPHPVKTAAAASPVASPRPARPAAPGPRHPLRPAGAPAKPQASIRTTGARKAASLAPGRLPAPRALAANPALVTAVRKGESAFFRPGGSLNSNAWLRLMHSATPGGTATPAPTGAAGLTSATVAKALATYGAAAQVAPVPAR